MRKNRIPGRAVGIGHNDEVVYVKGYGEQDPSGRSVELVTVQSHDLRRTYARRLYVAGMASVELQQNLGHADLQTTLGYIGTLDADRRRPPAVYAFDLRQVQQ